MSQFRQQQFLDVVSRDEAEERFRAARGEIVRCTETVPLENAVGRVLAGGVLSEIDVTPFDRANVDGFAVRAVETAGAMEERPVSLRLNDELITPGFEPRIELATGTASPIATGAMIPRGADAVVMVEDSQTGEASSTVLIARPVVAGENISFAGSDIARGETILRAGQPISSRESGVLAAIGRTTVEVFAKPRVAVISTGDEIIEPGGKLRPGTIYDSNATILSAAISEHGGIPVRYGIAPDDFSAQRSLLTQARDECDVVLVSGGTSKGAGDLAYRVVAELGSPGVVAHGVALKPGKPICLAVCEGVPIVLLPGFPTSAIFTFHEFVVPVIRELAGLPSAKRETIDAVLPARLNSARGRTEYTLVTLIPPAEADALPLAYPLGKGSGSVTTFSLADGFLTTEQHREYIDAGETVRVTLLTRAIDTPDLVFIGSHCVGVDLLIGAMRTHGLSAKALFVGSQGGLAAAGRAQCDVAGIHLKDAGTGEYNRPFLPPNVDLLPGYRRAQGIVFRRDDPRFASNDLQQVRQSLTMPGMRMVNRNAGSGTRVLIDELLADGNETRPEGFASQPASHNAVAAAIAQGRADWGVCIKAVGDRYGLGFLALQEEHYDFAIPRSHRDRAAVRMFEAVLQSEPVRQSLRDLGFIPAAGGQS